MGKTIRHSKEEEIILSCDELVEMGRGAFIDGGIIHTKFFKRRIQETKKLYSDKKTGKFTGFR